MLQFLYYIFMLIFTLLIAGIFLLVKRKKMSITENNFFKIVSIVLGIIFIVRFLSGDTTLEYIHGLENSPLESSFMTVLMIVTTWFTYASVLLITLHPFFKIKNLDNLIRLFVFPITVLNFVLFIPSISVITGTNFTAISTRAILMSLELAILLFYTLHFVIKEGFFNIRKSEVRVLLLAFLAVVLAIMPAYTLEALFGVYNPSIEVEGLTLHHRMFLYMAFLIPLGVYLVLKNYSLEVKRLALLYLSLATLLTFSLNYRFDIISDPSSWPLHLCHTAMYLLPISIIFKTERLFYFTYFINVLGAFVAMVIPDYGAREIISTRMLSFWINHYIAFFLPILIVALKLYPRPKVKHFYYSMGGFAVYFILVLFVNAWFSNYGSVDFFFLNNDHVASTLGLWAERTRDITASFSIRDLSFTFYPLYQALFFVGYSLAALAMWFIYEHGFVFADQMGDIAQRKRIMKSKKEHLLNFGVEQSGVVSMKEKNNIVSKLEVKNFYKRYGNSDNFAVSNASLKVNSGEVFGFLGPNGSGKSTIIKSIVGIHPPTKGNINVCGFDVESQPLETKRLIGFVPDHYALYENLTGREYVNYIADLYEVSTDKRNEIIERHLEIFNLKASFDNKIKSYSHGMKQKITIMAALVHEPKVWILDEPLTGLDPDSVFQVKRAIREHADKGSIVFFSSHILDVVEKICDKIAIINNGKIVDISDLKVLKAKNVYLEQYYIKKIGKK